MKRRVSGWCSDYQGACSSKGLHAICQQRLNDGLLESCDCTSIEGHTTPKEAD